VRVEGAPGGGDHGDTGHEHEHEHVNGVADGGGDLG